MMVVGPISADDASQVRATASELPPALVEGDDGLARCWWGVSTPDYRAYHDVEWGKPVHGEAQLFERLTLESFQSGLSWLTILRKRENFRRAFANFEPEVVALWGEVDHARLMQDAGIVRNRAKISAAMTNARAVLELRKHGGLDAVFWSFQSAPQPERDVFGPASSADIPSMTPQSRAMAATLKKAGFVFLGPTTLYAAMQACGVVNDHVNGCHAR